MKKCLAIILAALMAGALALPTAASPFSDLPTVHWALDAVRMLAALGIVEGYPDGTFKGPQAATRYEAALMIARALEYLDKDIAARLAELEGKLKLEGPAAGVSVTRPADTVPPDATILETIIADKIAAMTDAQWEEFDNRIAALFARTEDFDANNKAYHAAMKASHDEMKAALEALSARVGDLEKAQPQGSALAPTSAPAPEQVIVREYVKIDDTALRDAVAGLEGKIAAVAAGVSDPAKQEEAIRNIVREEAPRLFDAALAVAVRELEGKIAAVAALIPDPAEQQEAFKAIVRAEALAACDAAVAEAMREVESQLAKPAEVVREIVREETVTVTKVDNASLIDAVAALEAKIAAVEARIPDAVAQEAAFRALVAQSVAEAAAKSDAAWAEAAAGLEAKIAGVAAQVADFASWEKTVRAMIAEAVSEASAKSESAWAESARRLQVMIDEVAARIGDVSASEEALRGVVAEEFARAEAARSASVELLEAKIAAVAATVPDANRLEASLRGFVAESMAEASAKSDVALASAVQALEARIAEVAASVPDAAAQEKAFREMVTSAVSEANAKSEASVAEAVAKLEAKIAGVIAVVDALRDSFGRELAVLGIRTNALEEELARAKADVAGVRDSVAALSAKVAEQDAATRQAIDLVRGEAAASEARLAQSIEANKATAAAMQAEIEVLRAQAIQNASDIAETYHKIQTEAIAPLAARVTALEAKAAEAESSIARHGEQIEELELDLMLTKTDLIGPLAVRMSDAEASIAKLSAKDKALDEDIANIWTDLNRFRFTGVDELVFTDINVKADDGAVLYKDPWARDASEVYEPTSEFQNKLSLDLNIVPEPNVAIVVGLNAVTDVFGGADTEQPLFSGDFDLTLTTPGLIAKLAAGELSKPANFTRYQIAAEKFEDEDNPVEGVITDLSIGALSLTGILARDGQNTPPEGDLKFLAGVGGSLNLAPGVTAGFRILRQMDDPLSGDSIPLPDGNDTTWGGNLDVAVGGWRLGGEVSLYENQTMLRAAHAYNVYAEGEFLGLHLKGTLEEVSSEYAPAYVETVDDESPDYVEPNSRMASFTVSTGSMRGLVLDAKAAVEGDQGWATAKDLTLGAGAAYSTKILVADLKLKANVEKTYDLAGTEPAATTTNLGFDGTIAPVDFGFNWERAIEDNVDTYVAYVRGTIPVITDVLSVTGGWERAFSDDAANEYLEYKAGADLKLAVVPDVVIFGVSGQYSWTDKSTDPLEEYARLYLGADTTWQISNATKLTGSASYEYRDYFVESDRSGEYSQVGLSLEHQIYKVTSVSLKYDIKKVDFVTGGDYLVKILNLGLKTSF
ncbi:MAG: S-layer homology domain-containing protein [Firmicutes bacterium]|jgi:hypothetical protein|nr:S-layer homology domain-containing protein [Bacillota bacterium]